MTYNGNISLAGMAGVVTGGLMGFSIASVCAIMNPLQEGESLSILLFSATLMGMGIGGLIAFFAYTYLYQGSEAGYDEINSEDNEIYLNY